MTYNVFGGTLNLALSISLGHVTGTKGSEKLTVTCKMEGKRQEADKQGNIETVWVHAGRRTHWIQSVTVDQSD